MKLNLKYLLIVGLFKLLFDIGNVSAIELSSNELGPYLDEYNDNSSSSAYVIGEYLFTDAVAIGTDDIMFASRTIQGISGGTRDDATFKKMQIMEMYYDYGSTQWKFNEYFSGKDPINKYNICYIDYEYICEENNKYTVTFKNDNNVIATETLTAGTQVQMITDDIEVGLSKKGFNLVGWKNETTGEMVDENTVVTEATTYVVVWEAIPATLTAEIKDGEVGKTTEFTVSTVANGYVGTMVIGTSNFSDPDAIAKLEYYEVQNGQWYELTGDFGPSTGFPLSDSTSKFRVTWAKSGEYTFTMKVVDVTDNTKVYASVEETVNVAKGTAVVTNEQELLLALGNEEYSTIEFANNIGVSFPLVLGREVVIDGKGYSLIANEVGISTSFVTVSAKDSVVTLNNIKIDANQKARVMRINYGKIILEDSTVTNGLNNDKSLYAAGIYVNNSSELEFINSTITNNNVYTDYTNDNYLQYSADLFVGSITKVTITSGNIDNVFVNGNKYGNGLLTINGGTIDNVYLESAEDHGATLEYNGGTVNSIHISAPNAEGIVPATVISTPELGSYTSVAEGATIVTDEASFLAALENDAYTTLELVDDIDLSDSLTIDRDIIINGNGYAIKALETTSSTSFITIAAKDSTVVMNDVIIDANEKARAIRINYGKLIFEDSTVTKGLNNDKSLYAAGIYVNNSSELEFINSTITNNNVYTDYTNDNYLQYSADLFVGSITKVTITSGNIDNVFVNGNKYGNGLLTINGGTIDNVYLEYSEEHGATVNYNAGIVNNLYVSTINGNGDAMMIVNPEFGTYTSIK